MNMTDTLKGSYFAEVFPKGWDIEKIADCVSQPPESVTQPQPFWNPAFRPVACENLEEFGAYMGHEIAMQIRKTKEEGRKLILILPVGPMGMYKWAVYFLKEWNVDCKHVYGFNMDEWSDAAGNTLPASDPASVPERHGKRLLRAARRADCPGRPAQFCNERESAGLCGEDRRAEGRGRETGAGLRHWPDVPHRVLGAAFCR